MAKNKKNTDISGLQQYPRLLASAGKFVDYLDDSALVPHPKKIDKTKMDEIIREAIIYADEKSKRELFFENSNDTVAERAKRFQSEAKGLFKYFRNGDPATRAYHYYNKHFTDALSESYHSRALHMQHMNSGWRYQFIANAAAAASGRFIKVSDLNQDEADFVATIRLKSSNEKLNIYVSVKNRAMTVGGQNYPKIMGALEKAAVQDKNKQGPYICVFGIAIEKGLRQMRKSKRTGNPFSYNAEIWLSDFFWEFFTGWTYAEICRAVLDAMIAIGYNSNLGNSTPQLAIEEFGSLCKKAGLLGDDGYFNDRNKLVDFFCAKK